MFNGQDTARAERPCAEQALAPWAVYDSVQAVDSLIGYLNPQGQRESALKRVRLQLKLLILMADVLRPYQTAPLPKKHEKVVQGWQEADVRCMNAAAIQFQVPGSRPRSKFDFVILPLCRHYKECGRTSGRTQNKSSRRRLARPLLCQKKHRIRKTRLDLLLSLLMQQLQKALTWPCLPVLLGLMQKQLLRVAQVGLVAIWYACLVWIMKWEAAACEKATSRSYAVHFNHGLA